MKVFFAGSTTDNTFQTVLTKVGANNRLGSYWYLAKMNSDSIPHYIRTGLFPEKQKK